MDLVKISPNTWEEDRLVENYTSLIWTERYDVTGEVEIRSNEIDYMREVIPEKSLLGLRDSQEVMYVETHEINDNTDDDSGPEVVVRGRTFESFLENRATVIVNPTAGASAMWTFGAKDIWPTDAARALIMSHVTVATQDADQKIPNTAVANLVTSHVGEDMSYNHNPASLYDEVLNLIQMEAAGIRCQLSGDGRLMFYIYKGVDRTVNQANPVIFRLDADHIVDPTYLFSIKDYKNVAYVVGDNWQQRVYAPGVSSSISGINRRILLVDGSEIKSEDTATTKRKQALALGLAALAKHNQTVFFDGEVSPISPYIRGIDYNLGDKVTLMAQYGVSQTMLVQEFVRVEGKEGERAYPTLIVPG